MDPEIILSVSTHLISPWPQVATQATYDKLFLTTLPSLVLPLFTALKLSCLSFFLFPSPHTCSSSCFDVSHGQSLSHGYGFGYLGNLLYTHLVYVGQGLSGVSYHHIGSHGQIHLVYQYKVYGNLLNHWNPAEV